MPSLNTGDLIDCLLSKLGATESAGRHRIFEVFDDEGVLVARTWMSHSWRGNTTLSDRMVGDIRNQLGLDRSRELIDLVRCPLSREQYLVIVKRG